MGSFTVRALGPHEADTLEEFWREHWGSPIMVTRGKVHNARDLTGYVAETAGSWVGLLTYRLEGEECEVMSLDSLREGQGIGTALLDALLEQAQREGWRRLFLITTNDNTHALRFYQRRGWTIASVYPCAVEAARAIKPEIPLTGFDGIPIRDEIEMERVLSVEN
jgi:GNAT superfamily N-acetyltransferase